MRDWNLVLQIKFQMSINHLLDHVGSGAALPQLSCRSAAFRRRPNSVRRRLYKSIASLNSPKPTTGDLSPGGGPPLYGVQG